MSNRIASNISASVLAVSISSGGIPKRPISTGMVARAGIVGDGRNHSKHIRPDRAVSLLDAEVLQQLVQEGFSLVPGAAGENLTVARLNVQQLAPGTILKIGEAVLRLEQPRQPCYVLDAIDPRLKEAIVGRCGFLASVVREGRIQPGMRVVVVTEGQSGNPCGANYAANHVDATQAATTSVVVLLRGPLFPGRAEASRQGAAVFVVVPKNETQLGIAEPFLESVGLASSAIRHA